MEQVASETLVDHVRRASSISAKALCRPETTQSLCSHMGTSATVAEQAYDLHGGDEEEHELNIGFYLSDHASPAWHVCLALKPEGRLTG